MARNRNRSEADDFEDEPLDTIVGATGDGEDTVATADASEFAAMKARVAELEAENAALKAPAIATPTPAIAGSLRRFNVGLKHVPSRVVEAYDEANAQLAFKVESGVISSEHPFEVGEVPLDTPLTKDVLAAGVA